MTSNELVRLNRVPLWDAEVERIFTDIVATFRDEDLDPATKRGVLTSKAGKLERLVDQLDSGAWPEGTLSPVSQVETQTPLRGRMDALTDADFLDRWNAMTRAERLDWMSDTP
jgi:hypothetical protein